MTRRPPTAPGHRLVVERVLLLLDGQATIEFTCLCGRFPVQRHTAASELDAKLYAYGVVQSHYRQR